MGVKNEEKDGKTSLGSKALGYIPWRTALTVAAFAVPIAGLVIGTVVGALAYGHYRKKSRTEDSDNELSESNKEESRKESAQPGRLEKLLSEASTIAVRVGIIAVGFLLGGPIGGIIAIGLMAVDGISGGKLLQGVEKILNIGCDALNWAEDKTLAAEKRVVDKVISSREKVEAKGKPSIHCYENLGFSFDEEDAKLLAIGGNIEEIFIAGKEAEGSNTEAVLKRRENSKKQGHGVGS